MQVMSADLLEGLVGGAVRADRDAAVGVGDLDVVVVVARTVVRSWSQLRPVTKTP